MHSLARHGTTPGSATNVLANTKISGFLTVFAHCCDCLQAHRSVLPSMCMFLKLLVYDRNEGLFRPGVFQGSLSGFPGSLFRRPWVFPGFPGSLFRPWVFPGFQGSLFRPWVFPGFPVSAALGFSRVPCFGGLGFFQGSLFRPWVFPGFPGSLFRPWVFPGFPVSAVQAKAIDALAGARGPGPGARSRGRGPGAGPRVPAPYP